MNMKSILQNYAILATVLCTIFVGCDLTETESYDYGKQFSFSYESDGVCFEGLKERMDDEVFYIPETVYGKKIVSIGDSAFRDCTTIKKIIIPNGVTILKQYAFKNCTSLSEIVLPESITTIEYQAFYNCSSLEEISIPSKVTSISKDTFLNCNRLTRVIINGDLEIEEHTFEDTMLESVYIQHGVKRVSACAFSNCTFLSEITIPNSVTSIGNSAFSGCSNLTEIAIPDSVTSIVH